MRARYAPAVTDETMSLYDLRVTVERIEGRSVCGLAVGDYFEVTESSQDRWRRRIGEHVDELLPILRFVSLPIVATGFYDMTPDGQPIVDSLEEGFWVAAGFSGHGFMVAPSTGRLVA